MAASGDDDENRGFLKQTNTQQQDTQNLYSHSRVKSRNEAERKDDNKFITSKKKKKMINFSLSCVTCSYEVSCGQKVRGHILKFCCIEFE